MFPSSFFLVFAALFFKMSDTDAYSVGESNDLFTRSFYEILRKSPGNLFFSPISIEAALAMVYAGAEGRTAEQLKSSVFLPKSKEKAAELFGTALRSLTKSDSNLTLHIANALFSDEQFVMKKEFVKLLMNGFKAEPNQVNFSDNVDAAKKINGWVAEQTKDKIKELISKDSINALTKLVIVNAIYFKGNWVNKFPVEETKKDVFHLSATETKEVEFMNVKKSFRVGRNDNLKAQIIELPYQGDAVSMIVIVPDEIEGLKEIEPKLKDISLQSLIGDMSKREVVVKMPRFKIEETIDLNDHLVEMGLSDLFDAHKADLSGICDVPLYVSKAIQKAYIEVNEEGSEAAAATGVRMMMRMMPPPPLELNVDHPFLFYINSKESSVLFAGRVASP